MGIDRISNLPDNIIDKILSHLSIKDAVRTSVLSTNWKFKWAMMPHLVFSQYTIPSADKLVVIIDRVLLLHFGAIRRFELLHHAPVPIHNLNRWILYLSRCSIKELVLDIRPRRHYVTPACLFSCQSLTHLELNWCLLRIPLAFEGFFNLKSLGLNQVHFDSDSIDKLISSCPVLESLTLRCPDLDSPIKIDASNLRFFRFDGYPACITFENTSRLASYLFDEIPPQEYSTGSGHLINLKYLSLVIDLFHERSVLQVLYLLRSTPNIEELTIVSTDGDMEADIEDLDADIENLNAYYTAAGNENFQLVKLRYIKMDYTDGSDNEMNFINHMLSVSSALETMTILPLEEYRCNQKVVQKLLRFKRASPQAQIILLD